jgi:hypothetical protein
MHERGGLQRVLTLGAHVTAGNTMEFSVDQRRQTVEGGLVPVAPSLQKEADFLRVGGRHKKLSQNIVVVRRLFRLPD